MIKICWTLFLVTRSLFSNTIHKEIQLTEGLKKTSTLSHTQMIQSGGLQAGKVEANPLWRATVGEQETTAQ